MKLQAIGRIYSPYKTKDEAPSQGKFSSKVATIEIKPAYKKGLQDIANLSHILVLYWQDQSDRSVLTAQPPFADRSFGVFATRSPNRPNPIALCTCELVSIQGNKLTVKGLDALDGSPLLDIKPYAPQLDAVESSDDK
ncbi:tRNA (N6-threonylcarbamoyladenosine(37)-N6)-methyltransferase TrmO [Tetragenococcus halophilus subsp. flandriensis]|uniref:tRNA (N6-threonylcarbamoyladenosine(37)-N6)-methyltransferase TrmO n=1 Tax=Tetragenococcus halophilus TaxID=51669 RepID=UPI0023E99D9D|nr:tRNA (N6-threonylcarbamoyladenosine(37)-N6)-methyltransferase TrmO [Tetragenococcus halophilus]GMA08031.1 tRNA (N6-threonylcarbamoyladenosine(37)-N6)-methyltransferase TrmO [Tetragenococcus halophilus subsp. flandriensis]